jgi:hypothetical protein
MTRENRARPIPDAPGEQIMRELLEEIAEDERLSAALGVDLTPPAPVPMHAPRVYGPLDAWLRRSLEVHRFLEESRRAEHDAER